MKAKDHIEALQIALGIPEAQRAPKIGPLTRAAFNRLASIGPEDEFLLSEAEEEIKDARNINDRGLELVKHFEGLYLKAYQDSVGVWTIGWGHTGLQHKDGTVYPGRTITEAKATELLRYDMEQFESRVSSFVKVSLTDDQYSALVSFDFNTGGLHKSTLLSKLNAGDYLGAAREFLRWDKAGGKVLRGLTRRRQSEKNLFEGEEDFIVRA